MFGNSQIAMLKVKLADAEQRRSKGYSTRVAAWDSKRAAGREKLNEDEHRFARRGRLEQEAAEADIKAIDEQIRHVEAEAQRAGAGNPMVQAILGGGATGRTGSALAPLGFSEQQLRQLHQAVTSQQPLRLEARAFNTVDPMLPPQLYPGVIGPRHENRILDRLVTVPLEAPSVEWISHGATTGTAGVTAEGAIKNEAIFSPIKNIAGAVKIAVNAGVSWEITQDWIAYVQNFISTELANLVVDKENLEFLSGSGAAGEMTGWLNTSGILAHAVASETPLDTLEQSITALRVGPSLAVADLIILHPSTWSSIRRTKTTQGQYLTAPDPTVGEANTAWGVDVLTTTQLPAGAGIVMDTRLMGRVHVREPMSLRLGYSNDDFSRNIVRHIVEERLVLATERASAVMSITGLPTS